MIDVDWPPEVQGKNGLTMFPMWYGDGDRTVRISSDSLQFKKFGHQRKQSTFYGEDVLIFGGQKNLDIFSFDAVFNLVTVINKRRITSKNFSPPTKNIPDDVQKLQVDDWFYSTPILFQDKLLLLGGDHIHIIDINDF